MTYEVTKQKMSVVYQAYKNINAYVPLVFRPGVFTLRSTRASIVLEAEVFWVLVLIGQEPKFLSKEESPN